VFATPHLNGVCRCREEGISFADPEGGEPIEYIGKNRAMHCPFYYALRSLLNYDAVVQKYLGLASLIPRGGAIK